MDFFEIDSEINNEETIEGTPGNDVLNGGNGSSILIGLNGNDTLTGGNGSSDLAGDAGNDVLTGGNGGNTITGGTGNDTLIAGNGSNSLDGGEDDDLLVDGNSNNGFTVTQGSATALEDTLTGGSGADTFFFSQSESTLENSTTIINGEEIDIEDAISTVADFNASQGDKIQVDGGSFDVASGDASTLTFDNNTNILSLADEPVVRVTSGVDSDVLANTEIVDSQSTAGDDIIIGDNGGDATNDSDGEDGDDATANGEVSVGDDGTDSEDGIVDIFRFFQTEQGFHFYTSSEAERDTVQQQIDNNELSYSYEGESFAALAEDDDGDPLTGAKPVYRFFNNLTGAHLYTISETEKNNIADNLSDYNLEGVAYYAYDEPQENTIPLYRLYNSNTGTHFFTPSTPERDNVLDTLSQYSTEGEGGIAFHVLPSE